jgi:hypothetical protein
MYLGVLTFLVGPNQGRPFATCSKVSNTAKCKYFKWLDEDSHNPGGSGKIRSAPNEFAPKSGSCFKCR